MAINFGGIDCHIFTEPSAEHEWIILECFPKPVGFHLRLVMGNRSASLMFELTSSFNSLDVLESKMRMDPLP